MKEEGRAPDHKLRLHEETVNEESQNNAFFSSYLARKHFSTPTAPLMRVFCPFFFLIKQNGVVFSSDLHGHFLINSIEEVSKREH